MKSATAFSAGRQVNGRRLKARNRRPSRSDGRVSFSVFGMVCSVGSALHRAGTDRNRTSGPWWMRSGLASRLVVLLWEDHFP